MADKNLFLLACPPLRRLFINRDVCPCGAAAATKDVSGDQHFLVVVCFRKVNFFRCEGTLSLVEEEA